MEETLTLRLRAGEPAWCPEGTHIIGPDRQVCFVEEDTDVTFQTRQAFENAVKMVGERRDRLAMFRSVQLPEAGPVQRQAENPGADQIQALLARIERLEAARPREREDATSQPEAG